MCLANFAYCQCTIVTQPIAAQAVCEGNPANFSVTASGIGVMYQWKKNGLAIPGATSNTFAIATTTSTDAATYTLELSGACGPNVTSNGSVLSINKLPQILTDPVSQIKCEGQPVTFTVNAGATSGVAYQWRKGASNIPGATSSSYTIPSVSAADAANYTVQVSGTCPPPIISAVAALTVNSATSITTQPIAAQAICEGNPANFGVTANGTALTYQWKKNGLPIAGATASTFSIAITTSADAATYTVDVSGTCGAVMTSSGSLLTINKQPEILTNPISQSKCVGQPVTFTVNAGATSGVAYQWFQNATSIPGATSNSYNIPSVSAADAANYTVQVSGTCPSPIISAVAALTVNSATSITTQPVAAQAICEGNAANFSVTANGTSLTYQWKKNGLPISGANASTFSIATTSSADAATYTVDVSGSCGPNVASNGSVLTINEQPEILTNPISQSKCVGQPVTFTVNAGATSGVAYQWFQNATSISGATSSSYNIPSVSAADAANYTVQISGTCPSPIISAVATLTVNAPPTIITQPITMQSACEGTSASFSVVASGTALTYQWRKNGVAITGATASGYSIATTTSADAATYTVEIRSACGPSITSDGSNLNIQEKPEITVQPVASQTVCEGQSVFFAVNAGVTSAVSYQWYFQTNPIAGAVSSSYTILNAGVADAGTYYVLISGACSPAIASNNSLLNVNVKPTAFASNQDICSDGTTAISISNPNSVSGTTFSWAVQSAINVTGSSAGTGTTISDLLSLIDATTKGYVTYQIQAAANGCAGPVFSVVVTVNPTPNVLATDKTICGGANSNIAISNPNGVAGTIFNWVVQSTSNVSGASAGSGTVISQVLNSIDGINPGSVVYRITPVANGCPGISLDITVSVDPSPTITNTSSQLQTSICSNTALNFTPTSNVAITTYSWTSAINGAVTGVSANGTGAIADTPVNTGNTAAIVNYSIIPSAGGCPGAARDYVVTVKPTPNVMASDKSICSGSNTNVPITNPNGIAATNFMWVVQASTNVNGASAGTGALINQNLTSTDGVSMGTVTYRITPTANGCDGAFIDIIVTVNPVPVITNTTAQLQTSICSNAGLNFTPTSSVTGTTYSWTSSIIGPITGVSPSGNGAVTDNPVNTSNTAGLITYTITPNVGGCLGTSRDYNVTVNPMPDAAASDKSICAGENSNIAITNPNAIAGTSFNWIVQSLTNVSGAAAGAGNVISQILTTTNGISTGTVVYRITPIAAGCLGTPVDVTVIVKPSPAITNSPSSLTQQICSGQPLNFVPTSTISGSSYTWTSTIVGTINAASVSPSGFGAVTDSPLNDGSAAGTVTYNITPSVSGCSGTAVDLVIQVKPSPTANAVDQVICSGDFTTLNITPAPQNVSGTTYSWTASPSANIAGSANGNGSFISQKLTTTNAVIGTVVYTITPAANGCDGTSFPVTVIVNPVATVSAGSDYAVCEPASFVVSGVIGGSATTGTWTIVAGSGALSGSTVTANTITATYTVGAVDVGSQIKFLLTSDDPDGAEPCGTVSDDLMVKINRKATVSVPADYVVCESTTIDLSGTIGGSATSGVWSKMAGNGTLSASSVTGSTVTASYQIDPLDVSGTVTFRLTTNDPDGLEPCAIAFEDVNIYINRGALVHAGLDFDVCEDKIVQLNGSSSGSTSLVTWSGGSGSLQFTNVNNPLSQYNLTTADRIAGSILLTLTSNDPDGSGPCISVSDQVKILINKLPSVVLTGLSSSYAQNDPPVVMEGFPDTPLGSYTGSGVLAGSNVFDPSTATIGLNTITYTYTDVKGCTNFASKTVIVNPVTALLWSVEMYPGGPYDDSSTPKICNNVGNLRLKGEPSVTTGYNVTDFSSSDPALNSKIIFNGTYYFINTTGLPSADYSIKYTYTNQFGATSTLIKFIKVFASPVTAFTAGNACVNAPVPFQNNSAMPAVNPLNGTITDYLWQFGDPGMSTSIAQTPSSFSYAAPGSYAIDLTTSTDQGCSSTAQNTVTIGDIPKVKYVWSDVCGGDFTTFVNGSTVTPGTTITNYKWDFGDTNVLPFGNGPIAPNTHGGNTVGTFKDPKHRFVAGQSYTVSLSAKTNVGCVAAFDTTVVILDFVTPTSDLGYLETFTSGPGTWVKGTTNNSSWVFGPPNGQVIGSAPTGTSVWWTGNGNGVDENSLYNRNEQSTIIGPCINISGIKRPMIALKYSVDTQQGFDGAVIQYTTDGSTWETIGSANGDGINWYGSTNISGIIGGQDNFAWSEATKAGWRTARFNLDQIPVNKRDRLTFRIAFGSDGNNPSNRVLEGFAFDDIYIGEKKRLVLVEHFTNLSYPASNSANYTLDSLYDAQTGPLSTKQASDFFKIEYHISNPGPDSLNLYNPADPASRALYYSVSQPPATVMDGILGDYYGSVFNGIPKNIKVRDIDRRALEDPLFEITITPDPSALDNVLKATMQITYKDSVMGYANPVIMQLALVETDVPVEGISTKFENVVRKLLFDPEGKVTTQDWTFNATRAESVDRITDFPIRDKTKLYLVGWVQDKNTRRILQTVVINSPEKIGVRPVGLEDDPIAAEVRDIVVYPNPASKVLKISFDHALTKRYSYRLIDQRGVTVDEGNLKSSFDHPQEIDISDVANGIYFMQILNGNTPLLYRKIAVMNQ